MNEILATFFMYFAFCFFFEGIEMAITKRGDKVNVVTHILYSLFIIGTMIYFLVAEVVK